MAAFSAEAEADNTAVDTTSGKEEQPKVDKPEQTKKKGEFFSKIFEAIKHVFQTIFDFFKNMVSKIAGLFKKKEKTETPAPKADDTIDVNLHNSDGDANSNTSSNNASSSKNTDVDYINADIYYLNPRTYNANGINNFIKLYTSVASSVTKDSEILKNYGNSSDANAAANKAALAANQTRKDIMSIINMFDDAFEFKGIGLYNYNASNPGTLAAMKKFMELMSKEIKWASATKEEKEKGGTSAYKLIEILFGMKYDKNLGEKLRNKNAYHVLQDYSQGVATTKTQFANTIQPSVKALESPHNQLVAICDDFTNRMNDYIAKIESAKGNKAVDINAYWGYIGFLSGTLKVCTKLETIVVRCTSAVMEYLVRFTKLLDSTKNGTKRAKN